MAAEDWEPIYEDEASPAPAAAAAPAPQADSEWEPIYEDDPHVPQLAKAAAQAGGPTTARPLQPPAPSVAAPPPAGPLQAAPPGGGQSDFQRLAAKHLAGLQATRELYDPPAIHDPNASLTERLQGPDLAADMDLKNPYAVGAANVASGLIDPKTSGVGIAAILAPEAIVAATGFAMAGALVQGLIAGGFTLMQFSQHKDQLAAMQKAYDAKDWYTLKQKATELGVSLPLTILGAAGIKASVNEVISAARARVAADPPPQPVPDQSDLHAKVSTPPGASPAMAEKIRYQQQQAAIEARVAAGVASQEEAAQLAVNRQMDQAGAEVGWDPNLPKPHEQPSTPEGFAKTVELMKQGMVKTPNGDLVKPNEPVAPELEAAVQERLKAMGADPNDPQSVADVLADAKLAGLPADATEAGSAAIRDRPTIVIDPDLVVSQTKGNTISLPPEATATAIVHELEHFGDRVGANSVPPEGSQNDTALKFLTEGPPPDRGAILAERAIPGFQDWVDSEPLRYTVAGHEYATDYGGAHDPRFLPALGKFMEQAVQLLDPRVGTAEGTLEVMGKMMGGRLKAEALMATNTALQGIERKFSKLTPAENFAFIDRMKANEPHPEAWMDPVAKAYFDLNERMWTQLNDRMGLAHRGSHEFQSPGSEGYFRAIWKGYWDGGAQGKGKFIEFGLNAGEGNSPPQGSQASFNQASGLNVSELAELGYVPRYSNAGTMFKVGYADKGKTLGMWNGSQAAFDNGAIVKVPRGTEVAAPAGFVKVTDPNLTRFWNEMGQTPAKAEAAPEAYGQLPVEYQGFDYYAEPRLHQLMKQVFGKNAILQNAPTAGLLAAKSYTTGIELMFALPHAVNTMMITGAHEIASGMSELWNQGVRGEGEIQPLKSTFGKTEISIEGRTAAILRGTGKMLEGMVPPLAAARYIQQGQRLMRVIGTPEEFLSRADAGFLKDNPLVKRAVDLMFDNGAHVTWDETNTADAWSAAKDAFRQDENGRMIAGVMGGISQTAGEALGTAAVFKAISRQKIMAYVETFGQMYSAYADKIASGQMSESSVARQAWDHTDNLYGMIRYRDTWFWSSTFSSAMQIGVRAPGWTIGGAKIPFKAAQMAFESLKEPLQLLGAGDGPLTAKDMTPRLDPRTAFPIGLALVTAAIATAIQVTKTGTMPAEPQDVIFPQTGGLNDRGKPNRHGIFGYAKDWYSWATHPADTAWHKVSGIFGRTIESFRNRDFYGQRVYEPTDSDPWKFAQGAAHVLIGSPFAVTSAQQTARENEGKPTQDQIIAQILSATGNRPAPTGLENGPAENMMDQILRSKRSEMGVEPYSYDDRQKEINWIRKLRTGGEEAKQGVLDQVQEAGGGPALLASMQKRAQMPPGNVMFSLLTLPEMSQVWDRTTPEERVQWRPLFFSKLVKSRAAIPRTKWPVRSAQIWTEANQKFMATKPPQADDEIQEPQ